MLQSPDWTQMKNELADRFEKKKKITENAAPKDRGKEDMKEKLKQNIG